jgi:hypothetical protein
MHCELRSPVGISLPQFPSLELYIPSFVYFVNPTKETKTKITKKTPKVIKSVRDFINIYIYSNQLAGIL